MAFAQLTIDETVQIPVPTPCDLCDSEEEVNSFCRNCAQKLCDTCKRSHLRSTISRDHVVVHISEGSCHFEEPTICLEHRNTLGFYCRSCDSLCCPKCLAKRHNGHNFVDTDEYAKEVKRTLSFLLSSKEKEREKKHKDIQALKKAHQEYLIEMNANKAKVIQTTNALENEIRKITTELISKINQGGSEGKAVFEQELKVSEIEESHLNESIQKLKVMAAKQENIPLIRAASGLRKSGSENKKDISVVVPVVSLINDGQKPTAVRKIIGFLQTKSKTYCEGEKVESSSKAAEFCNCSRGYNYTPFPGAYGGNSGHSNCEYCLKRRKAMMQ